MVNLPDRPQISCAFDLLVLGVLLSEHEREILSFPKLGESVLLKLTRMQIRWPRYEGVIKALRGILYQIFITPTIIRTETRTHLKALIDWLRAIGEDAQVERLGEWEDFLQSLSNNEDIQKRLQSLAADFSKYSEGRLGEFTKNVASFIHSDARRYRWRYDAVLLQRTRVEYHLAMVGNEILNSVNRDSFIKNDKKVVLLPPCMKALVETQCKATMTDKGEQCAGCTPSCMVHQISKLGEKHGYGVYIIPEELRVFAGDKTQATIGIVGISCLLTNWSGGWAAERLGIPAQGVLLDYVGCKYHWNKEGFPTDTNIHKLLDCLAIKQTN